MVSMNHHGKMTLYNQILDLETRYRTTSEAGGGHPSGNPPTLCGGPTQAPLLLKKWRSDKSMSLCEHVILRFTVVRIFTTEEHTNKR